MTSSTVLSEFVTFNLPISSYLTGLEADALKHHQIGVQHHSTGAQAVDSQAGLQERAKEALVDGIRKAMSKGRLQAERERDINIVHQLFYDANLDVFFSDSNIIGFAQYCWFLFGMV